MDCLDASCRSGPQGVFWALPGAVLPWGGVAREWRIAAELESESFEDVAAPAEVAESIGYVLESKESNDSDHEIAQDGHHARRGVGADLRAVFVERYIAHPMTAILDSPMISDEGHEFFRCSLLWREAGDDVGRIRADFACAHALGRSFDLRDLSAVGEDQVLAECGRDPDAPLFDAAVVFT